jgi:predicted metal-dependent phosphoesterase TrpH
VPDEPGPLVHADLHSHSAASFDSIASAVGLMRAGLERGLTHLAITDHERIDGALAARERAPEGLTLIVGQEVRCAVGDAIGLYLERPIPAGLSLLETAAAVHEQGGLMGIPHPFDRWRSSSLARLRDAELESVLGQIDFIEAFNGRVPFSSVNQRAADFAQEHGIPGVASSDAHSLLEVGVAYTTLPGPITDAASLKAALPEARLVTGRGSFVVRAAMPLFKAIQTMRGNRPLRSGSGRAS